MNSSNLIGQNLSNFKGVMFYGVPHASGIERPIMIFSLAMSINRLHEQK
jgi:hypothetical protein